MSKRKKPHYGHLNVAHPLETKSDPSWVKDLRLAKIERQKYKSLLKNTDFADYLRIRDVFRVPESESEKFEETLNAYENAISEENKYLLQAKKNFYKEELQQLKNPLKASFVEFSSCKQKKCNPNEDIVRKAFEIYPVGELFAATAARIQEKENKIAKFKNNFMRKYSSKSKPWKEPLDVVPNPKDRNSWVLAPHPNASDVDAADLLEYQKELGQMRTDLNKIKYDSLGEKTEYARIYNLKREQLDSTLLKTIWNLKALALCCEDNACRAQMVEEKSVRLNPKPRSVK